MNSKKFYAGIVTVFFFATVCCFSARGQTAEGIGDVFKEIDAAVAVGSTDSVSSVLKKNRDSASYPMIESYTMKKIRYLIISNKLELARETSLAVIDNNMENFDAIELYSYIDKAIVNQRSLDQAAAERKRREEERIAALNEQSRHRLENRGNYQLMSTAAGEEVYMNEQKAAFSPFAWTVRVGIADFMYQKITDPDYSSLKYGLAFGYDMFYSTERFVFGADVFADALILTIGDGEQEFFMTGKIVPKMAFADFSKNLFLRLGFAVNGIASNNRDVSGSCKTFVSPVVGFSLDNLYIGETRFSVFYDYEIGHVAYSGLKSAMEFGGAVLFPLALNDRTKVGIELGVQNLLLIKDEGIENRAKCTFAIGVGNVAK